MMPPVTVECAAEFSCLARRNHSISPAGLTLVFASLMGITLMIGIVFALVGAPLVLPFAGIEIAVLSAALAWTLRHALDFERIRLERGMLRVEVADGGRYFEREFNPAWARLVMEVRGNDTRLALRSHGHEYEIGRHLNADGRRGLARSLGTWGVRPA